MMSNTPFEIEIESLPISLKKKVADFVAFLKLKNKKKAPVKSREFGYAKGKIQLSPNFDNPLEIFKEYM